MENIILASGSPRRKQLLEWANIRFSVLVSDIDETFPTGMPVNDVPVYIAEQKSMAVAEKIKNFYLNNDNTTIIAADTIVVINDQIIGKPQNREEAINTLLLLSGQTHRVITGVAIKKGNRQLCFSDITLVKFHRLTSQQIEYYVDNYSPYDKAGAYAIQEWIGVIGIESINGDYYNVMGLPISKVVKCISEIS